MRPSEIQFREQMLAILWPVRNNVEELIGFLPKDCPVGILHRFKLNLYKIAVSLEEGGACFEKCVRLHSGTLNRVRTKKIA